MGPLAGLFGLSALTTLSDTEGRGGTGTGIVSAGASAVAVYSLWTGNNRVNECRMAQMQAEIQETSWIGPPAKRTMRVPYRRSAQVAR